MRQAAVSGVVRIDGRQILASNKSRLLRLYRYLYVNTDDRHYATKAQIMDALGEGEAACSRQTVRDDIDALSREGYDIETVVSSGNYYYFRDREFTLEELKAMSDAVASFRFLGRGKKEELIRKLKGFCSRYQAEMIERHLVSVEPAGASDARIYRNVDAINDAINLGKKIGFRYRGAAGAGRAGAGETVTCTPLGLAWDGGGFRLAALEEGADGPLLYETERIEDIFILEEAAAKAPAGFRLERFAKEEKWK